jgi:hypothetical protein
MGEVGFIVCRVESLSVKDGVVVRVSVDGESYCDNSKLTV